MPAVARSVLFLTAALLCRGSTQASFPPASAPPAPTPPAGSTAPIPADVMPFRDVKAGMKGVGRTVFRAGQVEEFGVEILGKLENIGPQQNLILARLSGGPLEETGVLEGMSGSPVYVGGKMIGAVAYSWDFERSPIAGITPIEEMLRLDRATTPFAKQGIPQTVQLPPSLRSPSAVLEGGELVRTYEGRLARLFSSSSLPLGSAGGSRASGLRPVGIPITFSGLPAAVFSRLTGSGFTPQLQGNPPAGADSSPLQPGSAVGIALLRGDLQATAVGTVTRVDGDRVLALGHPLFNLGPVELPMTRAHVEALLPSFQSSFKFAGPAGEAGALREDSVSGVLGGIGQAARMIPVHVDLSTGGGASRSYSFEVADHPLLSPILVFLTLGGLFNIDLKESSDASVELLEGSEIKLSGNHRVSLANLFAGDQAVLVASATVAFLSEILMENEFEPARIEGITLAAKYSEQRRVARITSVWCDRVQARAGESVTVSVSLKPYREPERTIPIKLEIPPELSPGKLALHIGDAIALYRTGAEGSGNLSPRDLDHLVALINSLRRSERVYILATREEPSIWIGDQALPNLPPSKRAVIIGPTPRGNFQLLRVRPVFEKEAETAFAIDGYRRLDLEVVP